MVCILTGPLGQVSSAPLRAASSSPGRGSSPRRSITVVQPCDLSVRPPLSGQTRPTALTGFQRTFTSCWRPYRRQDRPAWPLDRFPDGRGHGAARAVWADPRCHRRVASNAAASPMLSVAVVTRLAGRQQQNCTRFSPERTHSTPPRRPPTGQTRRACHAGALTVARAARSTIRTPLDGPIDWPSGHAA